MKRLLFGSGVWPAGFGEIALTALRVFAGLALAFGHGMGKLPPSDGFVSGVAEMGFPMPEVFAWLASLAEFGGGLCLAIGLFTRPSAFFVAFTMAVAGLVRHAPDPFQKKELALMYLFVALVFMAIGGGRLAADRFLRNG